MGVTLGNRGFPVNLVIVGQRELQLIKMLLVKYNFSSTGGPTIASILSLAICIKYCSKKLLTRIFDINFRLISLHHFNKMVLING